jgi:hypothetical protein
MSFWVRCLAAMALGAAALTACGATDSPQGSGGGTSNAGTGGAVIGSGGSPAGGEGGLGVGGGGGNDCDDTVDVVFAMDVSTSMDPFLRKLADEILVVDQAVNKLNLNAPPSYGLIVFVDDTTFVNSSQPYIDIQTLQADFRTWASFTQSNRQTSGGGTNKTWPENSLDALYRAAAEYAWRPIGQSLRMIIHTTDDTFWEGPTIQDGVQIQHGYAETLKKLQDQQVRVFSFAATVGGQFNNIDVTAGWFAPYGGMPPIPSATGGNAWNIDDVLSNQISLSAAINSAIETTRCQPYPTPR